MAMQGGDAFAKVLDEISLNRDEPAPHVRLRSVGNPAYQVQFVSDPARPLTAETLGALYVDELVYDADAMASHPTPNTETDPAEIAAELAITANMSNEDLYKLRRRFALANHPDRLHPMYRETATKRMMVANRLIDEAIFRRP